MKLSDIFWLVVIYASTGAIAYLVIEALVGVRVPS